MARYTGPSTRIARKFGEAIFGDDKAFEKRNYPPGQHGMAKKRGKKSEYAVQLMEKQKAKYSYGILEKQFRNLFEKASATKGVTGEVLLQLCESRLDNVVFRMGIAPSRRGARQIVSHRHITVNGEVVNIPSKIFLNEPYSNNLAILPACFNCNNSYSDKEQYLACLIDYLQYKLYNLETVQRSKIQKTNILFII
jgi:ribosomal protein S4